MTIPGIGYYTALLVKAEIGDVSRFRRGDQLCSYAGIVPSTYSSGGVTRHGGITREGSRWLRWAMVEAATTHIKYDTSITRKAEIFDFPLACERRSLLDRPQRTEVD